MLHYASVPRVDRATLRLRIWGRVASEVEWGWSDLERLGGDSVRSDFHCVTTWSTYDNDWEGVRFCAVAANVRPREDARHVMLHSSDGYTTNVPLRELMQPEVLLVWAWNGQPLPPEHGGPLRMVVPKLYAWKSAKWLCGMEFLAQDRRGYWEDRGYHNRADPWLEERYSYQETGRETDGD